MIMLARVISAIFNPVVLLLILPYFLVERVTGNPQLAWQWFNISALFLLFVAAFVVYHVERKNFSDLDVSRQKDRPRLFLFASVIALLYLILLLILQAPVILTHVTFGIIVGVFIVSIVNNYVKASIHEAVTTAIIVAISFTYGSKLIILLLLIPLLGWARVKTKRHTIREVVVGGMIGLAVMVFVYVLVRFVR